MKGFRLVLLIGVIGVLLILSGCRFGPSIAGKTLSSPRQKSIKETPSPLPVNTGKITFSELTLDGRSDPFLPLPEEYIPIIETPTEKPEFTLPPMNRPIASAPAVTLRGIVLGAPPLAYIDDGSGALRRVTIGDALLDGRVKAIADSYVIVIDANNRESTLRMEELP